jgi:hypothetical protein
MSLMSSVSSSIIQMIQDIEAICVAGQAPMTYFYFGFRKADKQYMNEPVPSLITQFSACPHPRRDILSHLHLAHDNGKKQSSDSILA